MENSRDKLDAISRNTSGARKMANQDYDKHGRHKKPLCSEVRELLSKFSIEPPKKFDLLPKSAQLDHIATRILADSRTTTSHTEMREEGILSVSQYERRLHKEVYSDYGTLNNILTDEIQAGVFGRAYVKMKNEYVHGDRARKREYVAKRF